MLFEAGSCPGSRSVSVAEAATWNIIAAILLLDSVSHSAALLLLLLLFFLRLLVEKMPGMKWHHKKLSSRCTRPARVTAVCK